MTKKLIRILILFAVVSSLLTLSVFAANTGAAEVTADVLNFRSQPSTSGAIIGQAYSGEKVLVLEELSSGWSRVRYDGKEGYMSSKYLKALGETEMKLGTGKVTGDSVRFRSSPDLSSTTLFYTNKGYILDIIGVKGEWYKAVYNGTTGYIHSNYVTLVTVTADASSLREKLVATAKQYIGYSYVWGGASPSTGFDCSGLMHYAYSSNGITINRTSSTQYTQGTKISKSELQPGDLVFFASASGWYISHVGMYIGNGQFVHASSGSGVVKISDLSNWYYSTYYYGAARMIG
jgi:cell wall-associated NlpC family hydrolase